MTQSYCVTTKHQIIEHESRSFGKEVQTVDGNESDQARAREGRDASDQRARMRTRVRTVLGPLLVACNRNFESIG